MTALTDRTLRTTMLRLARLLSGREQWQVARAVGASQTSVSRWERGSVTPSLGAARALAADLDVPIELIGHEVELVFLELHDAKLTPQPGYVLAILRIPNHNGNESALTSLVGPA